MFLGSRCLMFVVRESKQTENSETGRPRSLPSPESPYFTFQMERQGVSNVDTPEVCGRVHVCAFLYECV